MSEAISPLYTTPELSLTVTGAPIISCKNELGSLPSDAAPFSIASRMASENGCLRWARAKSWIVNGFERFSDTPSS